MMQDTLQLALALIAVGGIGGIWFRLGTAIKGIEDVEVDVRGLTARVRELEKHTWKGLSDV